MLSLVRWLSRRPLWLLHALGAPLGCLAWALSPSYRGRFAANAAQARVAPADARPAIAEAGRLVMELPFLWLRPAGEPIGPRLRGVRHPPIAGSARSARQPGAATGRAAPSPGARPRRSPVARRRARPRPARRWRRSGRGTTATVRRSASPAARPRREETTMAGATASGTGSACFL